MGDVARLVPREVPVELGQGVLSVLLAIYSYTSNFTLR